MNDGKVAQDSGLCKDCDECFRFSGNQNQLAYRCMKCKEGFHTKTHDNDGHCHPVAQTHCSKSSDGTPSGKFVGMEKVGDVETCVDAD